MLVLTRKSGDSIRIGKDIEVTVIEVRNRRIRIGIHCPREISVRREELIDPGQITQEPKLD